MAGKAWVVAAVAAAAAVAAVVVVVVDVDVVAHILLRESALKSVDRDKLAPNPSREGQSVEEGVVVGVRAA